MLKNFVIKHKKGFHRALEILPGFVSWNLILFPYWGIFVVPVAVAYFVLIFDIYWFFQGLTVAITSSVSHLRIEASKRFNWKEEVKSLPDWQQVQHMVIIPTYKEPLHVLERTIGSLLNQDITLKQLHIVLAMEAKEDEAQRSQKVKALKVKFGKKFGTFLVTVHKLVPGEVVGKAANERYATLTAKKEIIQKKKLDERYITVTSCDADHYFHPKHFSCLTYKFLDDPDRYYKFWQPAVMFYQNIWKLPAPTRVVNSLSSVWNLSQLPRKDRLVNAQNYSLSFRLLDKVGYWDADVIPEDYHIFFKTFYKTGGKVEVEAIYLPLFADAPESESWWGTIKNQYFQYQRWAWGVSDDPYVIKNFFLTPGVPFITKTFRLIALIREHFLWPVNWFVITIGISIPVLLNPSFARTVIGYTLPGLSSGILTLSLSFLAVMLFIESKHKPPRPHYVPAWRAALVPFEYLLMPVVGLFLGALPGIDAHTRLMLGKYMEYRVTEKV
ncbi:MAG: glycosyltransferase family 2 protein [Candidatus Blackburnbacteria bacterium]|nr:glycosyltransferase family 2 protein [Candidatus Blackburnbacteria bacterium]